MTDRKFIITSIKMDLHRVVTAAGNINQTFPLQSIREFLDHALADFDKLKLSPREKKLRNELEDLTRNLTSDLASETMQDPHLRLRWTEDVMTIRNRL